MNNDQTVFSWKISLILFRLHIINILLKREYSLEKIYSMLEQAVNDPVDEIKEIVSALVKEFKSDNPERKIDIVMKETPQETITLPLSLLTQFKPISGTPERLGQQAYNFFNLGKLQSPENKAWADRLWESDGDVTRTMLAKVVDYNN